MVAPRRSTMAPAVRRATIARGRVVPPRLRGRRRPALQGGPIVPKPRRGPGEPKAPRHGAGDGPSGDDRSPSRYIQRVVKSTGAEVPGPIEADELLVHAHRD